MDLDTEVSGHSLPWNSWTISSFSSPTLASLDVNLPPTRESHEKHLMILDRFLEGVHRAPHRFTQKVHEYRVAEGFEEGAEDGHEDDDEVSISV